jgi:hypothetical protein
MYIVAKKELMPASISVLLEVDFIIVCFSLKIGIVHHKDKILN